MKIAFLVLAGFLLISNTDAATIYKWVDEKGGVHLTDDYNKVPASYRGRVQQETIEDSPEMAAPSPSSIAPQEGEDKITDRYGLGETYWRDRVKPWKAKLEEAEAKYESVNKKYMERSEFLSQRKFGSRTQYKMDIAELDKLNVERKKYEAEMNEANNMLNKIWREAEEAKADPEWLK